MKDEMNVTMNSQKVMAHAILHVTIKDPASARFRRWLGIRLIKLAAWVIGCGIEFNEEPLEDQIHDLYRNLQGDTVPYFVPESALKDRDK